MRHANIALEIINIIFCIRLLLSRRIKIDFGTLILIMIDLLVFQAVSMYGLKSIFQAIVYPVILLYCMIELKINISRSVLNFILSIIIINIIQLGIGFLILIMKVSFLSEDEFALVIQLLTLIILFLIRKILKMISELINSNKNISRFIIIVFSLKMLIAMVKYRINMEISIEELVTIIFGGLLLGFVLYYWQKEKMNVQVKEMELQISRAYYDSFEELIGTIRRNQHDFHNHLQAIYSLHYSIHDYDTLVAEQEKYLEFILESSKFYKLLSVHSPVITGFLYRKFLEADAHNYIISYNVKLENNQYSVPEYILVEIIGILWDNAIESGKELDNKKISFTMKDTRDKFEIEVSNPIPDISYEKIHRFFEPGNTTKGKFRGIGLSKIKEYRKKYKFDLIVRKDEIEGEYWLCIKICFPLLSIEKAA